MNAARDLSQFVVVDLIEKDVALMQQDHRNFLKASLVSKSEVKATRTNIIASTPTYSELFMMMLRIFENLLFALFVSSCPLYKQVYVIVKAVRD